MKTRRYFELVKLKGLMGEKKISYRKLSKETKISVDALNNKINGYSLLNAEEIYKIVDVLEISPDNIITYFFPQMLRNVS